MVSTLYMLCVVFPPPPSTRPSSLASTESKVRTLKHHVAAAMSFYNAINNYSSHPTQLFLKIQPAFFFNSQLCFLLNVDARQFFVSHDAGE